MALTGLQIFKLLPNTNCKKCGQPTCLAFAMKLAAGKESLDKCPDATRRGARRARRGVGAADPRRHDRQRRAGRHGRRGDGLLPAREDVRAGGRGSSAASTRAGCRAATVAARLDEWAGIRIERAGEAFQVDGIAARRGRGRRGLQGCRGRGGAARPAGGLRGRDGRRRRRGPRADQGASTAARPAAGRRSDAVRRHRRAARRPARRLRAGLCPRSPRRLPQRSRPARPICCSSPRARACVRSTRA